MQLPTAFRDFLQEIRPTQSQRDDYKRGHIVLRERLLADEDLKPIIVAVFIQGSYRRSTAIRPSEGQRSDVDLVVVTNLDSAQVTPAAVLRKFTPFMRTHYDKKWRANERSLGIELSYVDLDLVVTSAPAHVADFRGELGDDDLEGAAPPSVAEATAWKQEPLLIPDRQWARWDPTHPLVQLAVTRKKNAACNGHFVNVVKAIKWWKRQQQDLPKHPRSYPLERLIFECCPDGVASVADGVTRTLEIIGGLSGTYVPSLDNPGVRGQNVLARVPDDQFRSFVEHARGAARLARRALDDQDESTSAALWRELLGPKFPASGGGPSGPRGGFSPRDDVSTPQETRFA